MSIISRRLQALEQDSTESPSEEVELSETAAKLVEVIDAIDMPPMAKAVIVMLKRQLKTMGDAEVKSTLRDITTVLQGMIDEPERADATVTNITPVS